MGDPPAAGNQKKCHCAPFGLLIRKSNGDMREPVGNRVLQCISRYWSRRKEKNEGECT